MSNDGKPDEKGMIEMKYDNKMSLMTIIAIPFMLIVQASLIAFIAINSASSYIESVSDLWDHHKRWSAIAGIFLLSFILFCLWYIFNQFLDFIIYDIANRPYQRNGIAFIILFIFSAIIVIPYKYLKESKDDYKE